MSSAPSPLVLVADDDEDILLLVHDVLKSMGCSVLATRSGQTAMELACRASLALAVLDVRMPVVDGLTISRKLKDDPVTQSVPVLILTASVGEHQEQAALDAGADAFLSKPFALGELRATVRWLLDRSSTSVRA